MPRGFGGGGFGRGGFGMRRGGMPLLGMGGMGMGMGPLLTGLMAGGLGYLLGSNTNQQVTPQVKQVAPAPPASPQPVTCSYCGSSYLPAENNFACPSCGAAAPQETST